MSFCLTFTPFFSRKWDKTYKKNKMIKASPKEVKK